MACDVVSGRVRHLSIRPIKVRVISSAFVDYRDRPSDRYEVVGIRRRTLDELMRLLELCEVRADEIKIPNREACW